MCLERNRLSMLVPWNTKHQRELNRNSRPPLSGNWVLGVVQPLPHPFNRAQTCGCHRKKLTSIFYSTYIFPLSICVMSHVSLSILHLCEHTCGSGRLQMWGGKVDILRYSSTSFSEAVSKSALELPGMADHTSQLVLGGSQSRSSELK